MRKQRHEVRVYLGGELSTSTWMSRLSHDQERQRLSTTGSLRILDLITPLNKSAANGPPFLAAYDAEPASNFAILNASTNH